MGLYKYSVDEAYENFSINKFSRWYGKKPGENEAALRLDQDIFQPNIKPKFSVNIDDHVFAVGSCFARGIEKALASRGFSVESMASEFDDFELLNENVTGLGFTNKYSTFSILNEIKWALDPESIFPENSIIDLSDGTSIDPSTNPTLKFVGRQETIRRREIISNVVGRIKKCRVVFMTLGLVEVWYDRVANVYLNMAPTRAMKEADPERYEFSVTDYAENKKNLEELYCLLKQYGHPDLRIVVTVSPVPMMATFTQRDVVAANTYSKALLRTVAEEWAVAHKNVDYFPSYEIVVNSNPEIAWAEDKRHVQAPVVQSIMRLFADTYIEGKKSTVSFMVKEKMKELITKHE